MSVRLVEWAAAGESRVGEAARPPGRTGRLDWLGGTGGTGESDGRRAVRAADDQAETPRWLVLFIIRLDFVGRTSREACGFS